VGVTGKNARQGVGFIESGGALHGIKTGIGKLACSIFKFFYIRMGGNSKTTQGVDFGDLIF